MWKNFSKPAGWLNLIVSIFFVLLGIVLIINPEAVISFMSILLGSVFIVKGILKNTEYLSEGKKDNYKLVVGTILIVIGIIVMFCTSTILSIFRIIIAFWIMYSGIINLQTAIIWKDYKSKLWLITVIFNVIILIAGIYILINNGAIMQTIGIVILIYGLIDVFENIVFMKKANDYIEI